MSKINLLFSVVVLFGFQSFGALNDFECQNIYGDKPASLRVHHQQASLYEGSMETQFIVANLFEKGSLGFITGTNFSIEYKLDKKGIDKVSFRGFSHGGSESSLTEYEFNNCWRYDGEPVYPSIDIPIKMNISHGSSFATTYGFVNNAVFGGEYWGYLWLIDQEKGLRIKLPGSNFPRLAQFSDDASVFVASDLTSLAAYRVDKEFKDFSKILELREENNQSFVLFPRGDKLLLADFRIFNLNNSEVKRINNIPFQGNLIRSLSVSFDETKAMAVFSDYATKNAGAYIVDLVTENFYFLEKEGAIAAAFSKDGKFVAATYSDGFVGLFNAANGSFIKSYEGHLKGTNGVAFSEDDKTLVTVSTDYTVRYWDVTTAEQKAVYKWNNGGVYSSKIIIQKELESFLAIGHGGEIYRWTLPE